MTHYMNLHRRPFEMIAGGMKTIELRLYDEKRQKLQLQDTIVFQWNEQTVQTKIIALHRFGSFEQLYQQLPLERCGYLPQELASASYKDMEEYYPQSRQEQYGVLGIEIELIL